MIFTLKKLFFLLGAVSFAVIASNTFSPSARAASDADAQPKRMFVTDGGIAFEVLSDAATVHDFLDEQKISIDKNDAVFPDPKEKIYSGSRIMIWRAKKITIKEGGKASQIFTFGRTVEQAIWENKNMDFSEDDITTPSRQAFIKDGMTISVTHVVIKEETKEEKIDFKTVSNEDDSLGWRVKKVTQTGEKGLKEVKYRVVTHDGKEISRKILETDVTKKPVDEIVTQGTQVKLAKTVNTGWGTWYAQPKHLELKYPSVTGYWAANPWLPMGSYAKVTNKANGKSVIVRINDRGPFGENRIVDLGKPAFAAIASVGAGVIDVEMRSVTN